jgi:hypothetical protein
LEQSAFLPNARGDARNRWRDKIDLVLARSQLGKIDLASRSHDFRADCVPMLRLRVEPNDDPRFGRDIQRRLPLELLAEKDGFEAATAMAELAAESDLDGGLLAEDTKAIRARCGVLTGVLYFL